MNNYYIDGINAVYIISMSIGILLSITSLIFGNGHGASHTSHGSFEHSAVHIDHHGPIDDKLKEGIEKHESNFNCYYYCCGSCWAFAGSNSSGEDVSEGRTGRGFSGLWYGW